MSMRNDANDDFDDVPSLRADVLDDDDDFPTTARTTVHSRTPPVVKVRAASTGPGTNALISPPMAAICRTASRRPLGEMLLAMTSPPG